MKLWWVQVRALGSDGSQARRVLPIKLDGATPHTLTPSHPHTLTPSHPTSHTLTTHHTPHTPTSHPTPHPLAAKQAVVAQQTTQRIAAKEGEALRFELGTLFPADPADAAASFHYTVGGLPRGTGLRVHPTNGVLFGMFFFLL